MLGMQWWADRVAPAGTDRLAVSFLGGGASVAFGHFCGHVYTLVAVSVGEVPEAWHIPRLALVWGLYHRAPSLHLWWLLVFKGLGMW